MKNIAIAAVLFSLLVAPFQVATQPKTPPKAQAPATSPPAAAAPAQKSAPPAAPAVATAAPATDAKAQPMKRASRRVPSTADARVCLEFPTDLQVIKCADKYRWSS